MTDANLLDRLQGEWSLLAESMLGLERETLRVTANASIAQTPHAKELGSALTHPFITTDYAEALLELITPPRADAGAALADLADAHRFAAARFSSELFWGASMPCRIDSPEQIALAWYGDSNPGRMKHVYRLGLGHRYGRMMQVISGVHVNFSLADRFWQFYNEAFADSRDDLRQVSSAGYFRMLRNLQRNGWLVIWLFGASPVVDRSFVNAATSDLEPFQSASHYCPFATSLRLGDIGYQNKREEGTGIKASYDSLDSYIRNLTWAIETPCPQYERIGVVEAGEYRQLNANVLQIENEYYSSVRPKQPLQGLEKPTVALRKRGVGYVELRSLDNNPFVPLGVAEDQLRFLELLMLHSLMQTERLFTPNERLEIDNNLLLVAHYGRDDQLRLQRGGRTVAMKDWAREILESMEPIAEALESAGKQGYRQALKEQVERANGLREPLSARMLREMNENREDFVAFTLRLSRQHQQWLLRPWAEPQQRRWRQLAEQSWRDHEALERRYQGIAFEQFLADYFAQRAVD